MATICKSFNYAAFPGPMGAEVHWLQMQLADIDAALESRAFSDNYKVHIRADRAVYQEQLDDLKWRIDAVMAAI